MVRDQKVVVVMPAYNAAQTLQRTLQEIPRDVVDEIILVDDCSADNTANLAREFGVEHVIRHNSNKGYGGNQKSCYKKALEIGADIAIMVHPDYQYSPKLIESMVYIIANGVYPVVLGSRILGKGALKGGMPWIKYIANRFLTMFQNVLINQKLSEYHTGYRAFSREVLEGIQFEENSDDFVFDNQMLCQIFKAGFEIGEVTCPTKYFDEASSINLIRSGIYGLGVIRESLIYRLHELGMFKTARY